jgi:putative transposase
VRRGWIDPEHERISVRRQCALAGVARSMLGYAPAGESEENLGLLRLLDEQYTRTPFYGVRRMTAWLRQHGHAVNAKRVRRLLRVLGIEAVYPKPRLSQPHPDHRVFPYRLRGVTIERVNQVWSTDITYIRLRQGFVYLTAVIDWFSRYVLSWELSNTLDGSFCRAALETALTRGTPAVFNTDQGCQFTSPAFTGVLERAGITISMDGRGRCLDNVFVERLWRTVKCEEVYLNDYAGVPEARRRLGAFFRFYNEERLHQALDYQTPAQVWQASTGNPTSSVLVATAPAAS